MLYNPIVCKQVAGLEHLGLEQVKMCLGDNVVYSAENINEISIKFIKRESAKKAKDTTITILYLCDEYFGLRNKTMKDNRVINTSNSGKPIPLKLTHVFFKKCKSPLLDTDIHNP
jgi:hypothetical protein